MGSITTGKRKDGSHRYRACAQVMREGTAYHETKAFDKCPVAAAWTKKREKELARPGALEELNLSDPPLFQVIERY